MKNVFQYLFVVCGLWFVVSCGNSKTEGTASEAIEDTSGDEAADPIDAGKSIYMSNCKLCHGEDGSLGASGSANLRVSKFSAQDMNNIITYGKGNMTGFKGLLEPNDIKNVVAYIETLRNK